MSFWNLTNLIPGARKRPSPSSPTTPPAKRRRTTTTTTTTNNPLPSLKSKSKTKTKKTKKKTKDPLRKVTPSTRWNPAILPTAPEFTAVLSAFRTLLRDRAHTVDSILASKFSPHEQELLQPCGGGVRAEEGKKRHNIGGALARIQEENRWRYGELLRSARFRGWAGKADLAFKFTLVWFGLPVAPMGVVGAKPDPKMEAYYVRESPRRPRHLGSTTALGLRGGGAVSEDDSDDAASLVVDSTSDEEGAMSIADPGQVLLRGGAPGGGPVSNVFQELHDHDGAGEHPSRWSATDRFVTTLHTPFDGVPSSIKPRWVPLYGYQGVVWFRVDQFYTFIDAVDRLLGLDNRAGVSYNLYLLDKSKTYTEKAERDDFLRDLNANGLTIFAAGPGDYSNDQVAWDWLVDRLEALENDDGARGQALFVAGPGDPIPWTWEPDPSHRILKVVLDWADVPMMNRPDVAYFRMPENPRDAFYSNQHGPRMASICRVLAAGRLPNRPGYPAVPDAWFTIKDQGRGRGSKEIGTYGGLAFPPQLWDTVVAQWEKDKTAAITLEARTGRGEERENLSISDRWHLFLPGLSHPYEKQYILHDEVDDARLVRQALISLVKGSMSDKSFGKAQSLEVHLPGSEIFMLPGDDSKIVVSLPTEDMDFPFQGLADHLGMWKDWLEKRPGVPPLENALDLFPQFLSLRPVFEKYTICDADQSTEPLVWDPATTTLAQFRQLVAQVWSAGDHEQPYLPAGSWICITQGRPTKRTTKSKVADAAESKPRFLVGPKLETTEDEWQLICRMITEPDVWVSLQDKKTLPRFGDSEPKLPFGYRNIYQTPDSLLYRSLNRPIPASRQRHYDWQLWKDEVAPHLKAIQPWEKQPEPLTTFFTPDMFPLRPPPGTTLPSAAQEPPAPASHTPPRATRPVGANIANPSLQSLPQRLPDSVRFRSVTGVERGQHLRARSYAHPLDVQMHKSMAVNAPPVDRLLNLGHDSVPVVSLSVLTPTEVRRLQKDHHDMRNLVLSRTERCPYSDCDAVYPTNNPSAMQKHLQDKHVAEKCNFCDEALFAHWLPEQRYQHFVMKHSKILNSLVAQNADDHIQIPDKKRTDRTREGNWKFCSRCGRDHSALDVVADRTQHDNICYPGVQDRVTNWSACGTCGDRLSEDLHDRSGGSETHFHREEVDKERPFCEHCALPLGLFTEAYAVKHLSFCKGHGRDNAKYCPWCGIELVPDLDGRMKHIEECIEKPPHDAEGPIDTVYRSYFLPNRSRVSSTSSRTKDRPAKRPRTAEPGAVGSETHKPRQKKPKTAAPPPISTTHRRTPSGEVRRRRHDPLRRRTSSGSSALSSAPSTSHSKRSADPWLPRAPSPPPLARPAPEAAPAPPAPAPPAPPAPPSMQPLQPRSPRAPPAPAALMRPVDPAPAQATPAKSPKASKVASKGKGKPKPKPKGSTKTLAAKPKQTKPAATTTAAATTTTTKPTPPPPSRRSQRYAARLAAERKRAAEQEEAVPQQQQHTAKVARTVSYAEPLVRGASPRREVSSGGGRLTPAIKGVASSVAVAGVGRRGVLGSGTRWGY
ncbi:hypothetical protein C8A00DRAFT_37465 [Chaetomidium leptoderma]|uniref:Uncharacterized protein n=1 Tax=Chaetomidium leptoderma TaxID=669021 RepID=A0AAN6ZTW6_9PEZI|nr:hypothetical protein C8A00DRAFT_37465 [Chaetomidium leptoderma]